MVEENALKLIPAELQTLVGKKPTISLPELSVDEAEAFVLGRFDFFRPKSFAGTRSAPFQPDAIPAVVKLLAEEREIKLIPREVLLALGYVYDAAPDMKGGHSADHAIECLQDYGR